MSRVQIALPPGYVEQDASQLMRDRSEETLGLPPSGVNAARMDNEEDPSRISTMSVVTPDYPAGTGQGPINEAGKMASTQRPELTPGLARVYDPDVWRTSGRLTPRTVQVPQYLSRMGLRAPTPNNSSLLTSDIAGLLSSFMPDLQPLAQLPFPTPWTVNDIGRGLRSVATKARLPDWIKSSPTLAPAAGAVLGGLGAAALTGLNNMNPGRGIALDTGNASLLGAGIGALAGYNKFRTQK